MTDEEADTVEACREILLALRNQITDPEVLAQADPLLGVANGLTEAIGLLKKLRGAAC